MILNHVTQTSALFVVASTRAHPDFFGHGDLHTIDEVSIPQWFENRIRESLHQQILHGLFTEIMIDPIHLMLLKHRADRSVEIASRFKIVSKWFLDDHLGMIGFA